MQNLHPLVVHFPIALLLTSIAVTLFAVLTRRAGAALIARTLLYLGTLAAGMAVLSGFLGSQTVATVADAREDLTDHQNFGYMLLGTAAGLSAWSILAWRRMGRGPRPTVLWLLAQGALAGLIFLTANEGGELVHEYGVGTKMTAPGGPLYEGDARPAPDDTLAPRPTGRDFR